jgi:predicted transcriptional regulator
MFLVGPKVFSFVVKGVKVIFEGFKGGGGVTIESYGKRDLPWTSSWSTEGKKERKRKRIIIIIIIIITRYDYNLTIMEFPKPATDNRFKK